MDPSSRISRQIFAALPGPELSQKDLRALGDLRPGGVTLFARNLRSAGQTMDLISGIRETVKEPTLLAVDQEGGPVNRLAAIDEVFLKLPDGRSQAHWGPDHTREVWQKAGACLACLGFDIDFAPVVDLDDGPGLNAIGSRSFGTDPGLVCDQAGAVLEGLAGAGIAGCLKHFPGLGQTDLDTHKALACSPVDLSALWERHALPYRRLHQSAPLIMTAHAHFPAIDGPQPQPGTFSRELIHGWLRSRIGYEGLIITDDLEMGALGEKITAGEKARRSLRAGADLLLFCQEIDSPRRARDQLVHASERGDFDEEQLAATNSRLDRLMKGRATAPQNAASAYAALSAALGEVLSLA